KPASLPVYPPNPCRIPASVFDGAPEIKSRIKSNSGSLRIVVWLWVRVRVRVRVRLVATTLFRFLLGRRAV
ncbi:hypothetical protein, partial [Pseudomonas lurida]|uniref:hypothetical protein n=1 Tax=Pseudomonas lurida TaxID=244566 RepID=UPI0019D6DEFF